MNLVDEFFTVFVIFRSPNLLNSSHSNNKSFRGSQSSLSTSSRTPSEQQVPGTGPNSGPRDRPSSAYLPPHGHHLNQVCLSIVLIHRYFVEVLIKLFPSDFLI